ncbi:MAG: cytochrome P450 [Nitriliruptorales bacterium]
MPASGPCPPLPPGPSDSLGLRTAQGLRRDVLGTFERVRDEFGDVVRLVVGPPGLRQTMYGVFHPEGVRRVLAGEAERYGKDTPTFREVASMIGGGLLTSQGERWQRQRRTVQPLFTPQRVATFGALMAQEAAATADHLVGRSARDGEVDVHPAFVRYTLRVVGRALFGDSVEDALGILWSTFPVGSRLALRRALAPVRLPRLLSPAWWRAEHARRATNRIIDRLVTQHRQDGGDENEDLVTLLLTARDPETGRPLEHTEIRDQALVFLLAGHETTASALTFALHEVARHPEVQHRLHEELDAVVGGRPLESKDASNLTYARMVVNETLRLHPSAYWLGRISLEEDEIGGYRIPSGSVIALLPWVTHRHPDLWQAPERFQPERFAPHQARDRPRYAHYPFGGGPRACVGEHFSLLEAVIGLATILQRCRVESTHHLPHAADITLRPRGPVYCRFSPR